MRLVPVWRQRNACLPGRAVDSELLHPVAEDGETLALRVTVKEAVDLTTIRVDGRLRDDGVPELEGACRTARRPLVLDLTYLMGSGDAGVALLRRLAGEGVHLLGASPYIALLLAGTPPGLSADPRRRRRGADEGGHA